MKASLIASTLTLALFAGGASADPIRIDVPTDIQPPKSTLTRAEVLADFHMWRLAGLQDLTQGERPVDTNSHEYRRAYATYVHLRSSPQFAALVIQLQESPGSSVVAVRQAAERVARATN
jgi:hypothetical protein